MAIRDTFVQVNDGDQLDDGFFNECYNSILVHYNDETTDLDTSQTTTGSSSSNKVYTVLAANIKEKIEVVIVGECEIEDTGGGDFGTVSYTIETSVKDAASYTTRSSGNLLKGGDAATSAIIANITRPFIYTLTAGEISGGVDIRVTITCTSVNGNDAVYVNKAVIVRGVL